MKKRIKSLLIGDAMIPGSEFRLAAEKYLGDFISDVKVGDWESDWGKLQERRLKVEKEGPEIEVVDVLIQEHGGTAELLAGLFIPISSKVFEATPKLRIAGVSRAGLENVNVAEATKRGIVIFNVEGRNAEAVSDFAIGMMISESRNIARAHFAIKNGNWRKTFSNSDWVPQLKDKSVGIVGFGNIGRLVAQKLSGFSVKRLVYDPFVAPDQIRRLGCSPVDKDTLFSDSDFVTVHARLSEATKNLIGKSEFLRMKPTAYLVNTARAGLLDENALIAALQEKRIAGAGLDVFQDEPLTPDSPFLSLDNVTLSTHIAGTTKEALSRSPELLMEDIHKLLNDQDPQFVVNKETLDRPEFKAWLKDIQQ
jgi:D-3-phosphoglycerate dehydrogenase / 2-oxoglutarate reductase